MILSSSLVFAAVALSTVNAQDLGVPLSWRKFSTDRHIDERIALSKAAIDRIQQSLDTSNAEYSGIGFWQSANVYAPMALHDDLSSTTTYRSTVTNMLTTAFSQNAHYDKYQYNDDAMWWASAAVYAYRTYGDSNLLNYAIDTWTHVSDYVVTAANAAAGSHPLKSYSLAGSCDGQSMEGGVFWRPTSDDQGINSITTGLYTTLSAHLADLTGDSKYTDAAIRSANWIRRLNIRDNIVLDSVNAHDCSRSPDGWRFTYNTGKFVEGLSILTSVTGDSQWNDLLLNLVATGVKNGPWQGSNGVITEGASPDSNNDGVGFKSVLIRGLIEAYRRTQNQSLSILIHSYVDVQYNALLDLASDGDNEYSSAWAGPAQAYTTWGQMAALDVLVAAIVANGIDG